MKCFLWIALVVTLVSVDPPSTAAAPSAEAPVTAPVRLSAEPPAPTAGRQVTVAYYRRLLGQQSDPSLALSADEKTWTKLRNKLLANALVVPSGAQLDEGLNFEAACLVEAASLQWPIGGACTVRIPTAVVDYFHGQISTDLMWFALMRGLVRGLSDQQAVLWAPPEVPPTVCVFDSRQDFGINCRVVGDVAYLRVSMFADGTVEALRSWVQEHPTRMIVLDLRNNGGGFFQCARHGAQRQDWFTSVQALPTGERKQTGKSLGGESPLGALWQGPIAEQQLRR